VVVVVVVVVVRKRRKQRQRSVERERERERRGEGGEERRNVTIHQSAHTTKQASKKSRSIVGQTNTEEVLTVSTP